MSYGLRRFLSAMVLLVGLPLYIIAAMYVISLFDRPPFLLSWQSMSRWASSGRYRSGKFSAALADRTRMRKQTNTTDVQWTDTHRLKGHDDQD